MSGTEPPGKNAHGKPTARPVALQGDLANLPDALAPLKALPNWGCWKWELRVDKNGVGKWTKPPLQPANPQSHAKTTDARTWGTYEQALAAFTAGKCDGIGFNLSGTDIAAFDLDNCRDKVTGEIAPEAMAIVNRAASYTEITPSGTGLRVIGISSGGELHRKQKVPGSAVEVETYRNTARYITITGLPLPKTQPRMADIGGVIDAVVAELDRVKSNGSGNGKPSELEDRRYDLNNWIEVNGHRHESDDDFKPDERYLPPKLKAIIANTPPAEDLSAAFHHAVCWLRELGWSARSIEAYIDGKGVVPQRYEGRLKREIYRCLHNAERNKASNAKANTAKEAPQAGGIPLEFYEDFDKTVSKKAIIKGVLYRGERSSWVGPPGSGKSALLADLALHAAEGTDWRGHRSKEKVVVLYFALERKELVKRRMRAHERPPIQLEMKDGKLETRKPDRARTNLPIAVAGSAIDLLSPASVDIIVETICAAKAHYGRPVGLIIIDTFNKGIAMGGGDENAAKDQNIAAANLQQVQDQTDVHIALIGHTGKDESRGARGSNAHLGDVDMMVQISLAGDVRTAAITKINDGMECVLTRFRVKEVTLGYDEDGDPITTAIVSDEVPTGGWTGLNKRQARAMHMLEDALAEGGEPAPPGSGYPKGATVVPIVLWRDHCLRGGLFMGVKMESARRAFRRAVDDLTGLRRIGVWDERVWIVPQ
jgi:hypothetical protein